MKTNIADLVVFIGEDGETEILKNRFGSEGRVMTESQIEGVKERARKAAREKLGEEVLDEINSASKMEKKPERKSSRIKRTINLLWGLYEQTEYYE